MQSIKFKEHAPDVQFVNQPTYKISSYSILGCLEPMSSCHSQHLSHMGQMMFNSMITTENFLWPIHIHPVFIMIKEKRLLDHLIL